MRLSLDYHIGHGEHCQGWIDSVQRIETAGLASPSSGGWRISGWAVDRTSHSGTAQILIVPNGMVSGPAVGGFQRDDVRRGQHWRRTQFSGWSGHFVSTGRPGTIEAYGAVDERQGEVCRIAGADPESKGGK
jgi:hypothetical protein